MLVEAGEYLPGDGEVVEGIASVDESAITGESAPVIRESGGDRSAVTGGTRVLSDWLIVRITADPGESFLDRMIAMVEGAKRQKTPNEIALSILLAALTIIFLMVCATPAALSRSTVPMPPAWARPVSVTVLIALLVCLAPTTIGGLALGHRHRGDGPAHPGQRDRHVGQGGGGGRRRGRAAAGQNRHDHAGQPPGDGVRPGRQHTAVEALADAAQLASLADETPGRAEHRGIGQGEIRACVAGDVHALGATFVPFTAQTRMSGVNMDHREIRKGAAEAIQAYVRQPGGRFSGCGCKGKFKRSPGRAARRWLWLIAAKVLGVIRLKDVIKGGIRERFRRAADDGHPHGDGHRRQPADRRSDRRGGGRG